MTPRDIATALTMMGLSSPVIAQELDIPLGEIRWIQHQYRLEAPIYSRDNATDYAKKIENYFHRYPQILRGLIGHYLLEYIKLSGCSAGEAIDWKSFIYAYLITKNRFALLKKYRTHYAFPSYWTYHIVKAYQKGFFELSLCEKCGQVYVKPSPEYFPQIFTECPYCKRFFKGHTYSVYEKERIQELFSRAGTYYT